MDVLNLRDIWLLVQAMNDLKAWRFIFLVVSVLLLGLPFAVAKVLPGLAAVITACH